MKLRFTRRAIALVACLLATAACSDAVSADAIAPAQRWKALPDGSWGKTWTFEGADGGISTFAERCWPQRTGLDCIAASSIGEYIQAARQRKTRLADPLRYLGDEKPKSGYSCSRTGDVVREGVFQGTFNVWLVSNEADLAAWANSFDAGMPIWKRPDPGVWSREFVDRYMRENSVQSDWMYLDCFEVTQLVRQGSAATINSTSLTYDAMRGEQESMVEKP